jgi:hypothetical protein
MNIIRETTFPSRGFPARRTPRILSRGGNWRRLFAAKIISAGEKQPLTVFLTQINTY